MVGRVHRAHGLRGEVTVEVLSDVAERFAIGSAMWAARPAPGTAGERLRIAATRSFKNGLLVRFAGYDDRTAAEGLRGAALEVDRSEVPPAEPDTWYWFELVDCRCVDTVAGDLGTVVEIIEDGGGLLLEVVRDDGQRLLVPFVRAFLDEVDPEARRIAVTLPEGLVETCTSKS